MPQLIDVYSDVYFDTYGAPYSPATLAMLRAQLNFPNPAVDSSDDEELQRFLDAALDVAAYHVGPLGPQTYTETHYGLRHTDRVVLDHLPVVSVASISVLYALGMAPYQYAGTDLLLDPATGVLRFLRALPMAGDVTVTYDAGSPNMSPSVLLGVLELAAHWYQRSQEGSAAGGGGIGQGYDAVDMQPGVMAGVPYAVLDKFRPHSRIQGIG